jgi:putative FmdB family regulatory protein
MPIYEYLCSDCDVHFERLVRRWGEAVTCPSCLGSAIEKQLSTFAVAAAPSPDGGAACGRGDGSCGSGPCGGGGCQYPS